ncbi:MAG: nitroreductase family protein [Chromatiaceae bacterium]|nr:nitroreductase family protein [Chromatiaceae bacterium]MCF8002788.1 nitroreductase family protein [Chromatiaceae bacterium]
MNRIFQALRSSGIALASNVFLFWENLVDTVLQIRYGKYGISAGHDAKTRYKILITAHSLEKALTFRAPREEFGKDKIRELVAMVKSYRHDDDARRVGIGVLDAYLTWDRGRIKHSPFISWLEGALSDCVVGGNSAPSHYGGVRSVVAYQGEEKRRAAADFIRARYSCRSFEDQPVNPSIIVKIVELAKRAPSQCNRQSSRAHCYQDSSLIQRLLDLQDGAKGYQEEVSNLFVITGDMNAWSGRRERNQVFVDGALFASGIMAGCTAYGIATCCLNLAVNNSLERKIKIAGGIPHNERLIMMIAFGNPAADHPVGACSHRLNNSALLYWH